MHDISVTVLVFIDDKFKFSKEEQPKNMHDILVIWLVLKDDKFISFIEEQL